MDKKRRLLELEFHRRKLSQLVSELLAQADEADQLSKLRQQRLDGDWHEQLKHTCRDLATLSEAVDGSAKLISDGKLAQSEDTLLRSAEVATHLSARLKALKAQLSS